MEQNFQPQQENIKNHSPILTITSSVLVTAIVVGFGMYFLLPKLTPTTTPSDPNISNEKLQNNIYVLSSVVTSTSPLETLNLVFDNQKVFLIQQIQNGETRTELKSTGDYIRDIFQNYEQPSWEPEISLFKNGDTVLIEILENSGGMAPIGFRTLFAINTNNKTEQKLYVIRESFGNSEEGVTGEPILITFFDKHDLILNCDPAHIEPNPSYRSLDFSNCNGVYFVEDYMKREKNLAGETQYDYTYAENKGYIYYNKTNKIIEQKELSGKQGQRAIIYTRFSDLMLGNIAIAVGQGEDVRSGGENRQLFELSLNP